MAIINKHLKTNKISALNNLAQSTGAVEYTDCIAAEG